MGGGVLLFNASHGIRFRAQATSPLRLRTGLSSYCTYRRDVVQSCLAIRSEANKGPQYQRNSKPKPDLSSKLISETSTDEADSQKEFVSFLRKIEASIKRGPSVAERSRGGQKKQSFEPKSKDKTTSFGHTKSKGPPSDLEKLIRDDGYKAVAPARDDIKSSGPPSYFDKLIRDNGDNAVASQRNDIKSSGPPSNFDKMIRDKGDNAVALPHDFKLPRDTSRFMRRSPIPISGPAKVGPLKPKMSISEELLTIMNTPRALKPDLKLNRNSVLKAKTRFKLRNKLKASPKLNPNSGLEAMTKFLLTDITKAEPELEPNSKLEAVKISGLRDIPKAEPELKPNSKLEAVTVSELRDIPKAEPELKPNSEFEAVTISQLRDIPKAEPELEVMTLSELKGIAKARGLKGYTRLKKAKLVEILKGTSL